MIDDDAKLVAQVLAGEKLVFGPLVGLFAKSGSFWSVALNSA
jgi:hypothetical protein